MKKLLLRRDVYACSTDDGAVLMDLTRGEYFGLNFETTAAIAPRIHGWIDSVPDMAKMDVGFDRETSDNILTSLSNDLGLLTEYEELGKSFEILVLHQTDCVPFRGNILPWPKIGRAHVTAFCAAYLRALLDIKLRPVIASVRRVEARKSSRKSPPKSTIETLELVRIFRLLRPFLFKAKDHCLFDSLALIEFLARFDAFPTWVIGVRTRPFAAHSWVVDGNLVLNELLEKTEEFSPILAI